MRFSIGHDSVMRQRKQPDAVASERDFAAWVRSRLEQRGRAIIPARGRSMQPAIPDGAYLDVRPVVFDELETGDLVVYQSRAEVICHRLIRKTGRDCVLKGDALLSADPPVDWSQVIGRVAVLIEDGERLVPLDGPRQRRRARWMARMSYPHALWQRVRQLILVLRRENLR